MAIRRPCRTRTGCRAGYSTIRDHDRSARTAARRAAGYRRNIDRPERRRRAAARGGGRLGDRRADAVGQGGEGQARQDIVGLVEALRGDDLVDVGGRAMDRDETRIGELAAQEVDEDRICVDHQQRRVGRQLFEDRAAKGADAWAIFDEQLRVGPVDARQHRCDGPLRRRDDRADHHRMTQEFPKEEREGIGRLGSWSACLCGFAQRMFGRKFTHDVPVGLMIFIFPRSQMTPPKASGSLHARGESDVEPSEPIPVARGTKKGRSRRTGRKVLGEDA